MHGNPREVWRRHHVVVTPERDPEQPDILVIGGGRADGGGGPRGRSRLRTLGLPLALGAVVLVAVITRITTSSGTAAAPSPSPSPSPVAKSPSTLPEPSPVGSAPVVSGAGHPLLGVTAVWELFGRGPYSVVRIELAQGRVTTTPLPTLSSSGPVTFLATSTAAVVRPVDAVPGYAVRDGKPAVELPGPLDATGPVLPGPDPAHLWVPQADGVQPVAGMTLVGLDGRRAGVSVHFPANSAGYAGPDGAGYMNVYAPGGVYNMRPGFIHRITTGALLAVGPSGWLTLECDEVLRCSMAVVDRSTFGRRSLPGSTAANASGVISPDGRMAAMYVDESGGTGHLHLIDLSTGADHPLGITATSTDGSFVWSPDSRWLFMAGAELGLHAFDTAGKDHNLGVQLPPLYQLAVRPAP
jgi:hypothetical protein